MGWGEQNSPVGYDVDTLLKVWYDGLKGRVYRSRFGKESGTKFRIWSPSHRFTNIQGKGSEKKHIRQSRRGRH